MVSGKTSSVFLNIMIETPKVLNTESGFPTEAGTRRIPPPMHSLDNWRLYLEIITQNICSLPQICQGKCLLLLEHNCTRYSSLNVKIHDHELN